MHLFGFRHIVKEEFPALINSRHGARHHSFYFLSLGMCYGFCCGRLDQMERGSNLGSINLKAH
jgi:hypothetical protein